MATAANADPSIPLPPGVPPIPADATPEQRDEHWFRYVYQADRMPQLTVRAVLMGAIIGCAMSIAHIYTSLKIGWGFGIAIAACVISYVSWNALRALSFGKISKMSILENNCMASTASSSGYSTGSTVATAVGALLLITGEHLSNWQLTGFVFFSAALGVLWAIPMKRQMINYEQLRFPSGIAAAETLRSLYSEGKEAMRRAYALLLCMGIGAVVGILRAPEGIPWLDAMVKKFTWMRIPDGTNFQELAKKPTPHLVGYYFDPSVLLIGAGMITGLRVSLSMLLGSLILYWWVGPWMISLDNEQAAAAAAAGAEYTRIIPLVGGGTIYQIIRWGLWGGASMLVMASLTALALQWRVVARSFLLKSVGVQDSARAAIEVPNKWLIIGVVPVSIGMILVQYFAFQIDWWMGLISIPLSFVIALVCSRVTGETDTTPTGAMGKVTQVAFAVISPGNVTHNLMSAGATSSSGLAAADLLTDLKSGYLLGANPRKQFIAQAAGVVFGTAATVIGWRYMVPDKAALEAFNPPATNIWRAFAEAMTAGLHTIPKSAQAAIAIGGMLGIIMPCIEKLFPKAKPYMPSATGLGFSWVMNFSNSFSFAIGAVISWVWGLLHKKSADGYNVPVASGLVAGESLLAAVIAILITVYRLTAPAVEAGATP